ncbi:MAG TPA: hypothetical protein VJ438_02275 [Candidatus Nanoarchaeia archaeon]|nr:hypothetical protein [Candidatus Nanoarchaeia archaeon]
MKMQIETFLEKVKSCKNSWIQTGGMAPRILVNPERTRFQLFKKESQKICSKCGTDLTKREKDALIIEFYEAPNKGCGLEGSLSFFEAEMLFMVWRLGKCPVDYASWHKSPAGKSFIENIKEIKNGE